MNSSLVDLLPPLLIVAPILAATLPIALGLRFDRTGWSVAAITTAALFAAAGYLASAVHAGGRVTHTLGGYPRTYGIQLVADQFSILVVLLVTGVATGVLAYTRRGGPRGNTFYTAYLLLVGGLLGISLTGDVFNLFVFLEISSLATYALVASGDGPESAVAALKYLILGTVAASMYLIGVAFVFMATGTLNMVELAEAIPNAERQTLIQAGFAFIVVGFATKVAQWPLHTWQPSAYEQAPDGATPLIAALVSTASAYAFGRLIVTVFEVDYLASMPRAASIVLTVGCVSVLAGTVLAVIQREVKRMLAYSSVSQFGLVIAAYGVVIAGGSETAFTGAAIHLVGHGILKAGLFLSAAIVATSYGARTVDEYAGLAKRRPVVAGAMAVLLFALVGVPPAVGFVGKWYIALGAVEAELWPVAAVIFLSTMLTLAYAARLLEKMYFTPAAGAASARGHGPSTVATDGGEQSDGERGSDGGDESAAEGREDRASDDGAVETPLAAGVSYDPTGGPGRDGPGRSPDPVSSGMVAVVVVAALVAVALGFAGGAFADFLEPFLTEVFN
ncbi:monovalent cation/H+ antiporter subunit D family protein [Haloterrigena sp. SYSU A121-1]|uniref:Monovalent cation/H+ antiporter subunit D family protein n=1 Tax=Haloterrigena gelatinilytica TaxID=2741724 RepID=A0A8J8GPM8_9EURY|nr:monovalent cation/H+ antiporter subunit D family protein [Haloterrigena gelatinilytica]NUB93983.1 monovalent cation/H+ antiporter subunit D family protein [Haloterrigena gelatinilytica]